MPAANRYLQEVFLPNYWNARNTVAPRSDESRYREVDPGLDLHSIFSKKYRRRLRSGQLFDFRGKCYRLKSPVAGPITGEDITIIESRDGAWKVSFRGLDAKIIPWDLGRRPILKKAS